MASVPIDDRLFRLDAEGPTLLGSRCPRCGRSFFPRRRLCAVCSEPAEPVTLSREGTLYSHTYVHAPFFGKTRVDSSGYGVGQVDLPEGVRVQAVLVGAPGSWRIGMRMRVVSEMVEQRDGDEMVIFRFAPAEG